jgi:hypothetical protein
VGELIRRAKSCAGSGSGKLRIVTALSSEKIALFAPMPSASVTTIAART